MGQATKRRYRDEQEAPLFKLDPRKVWLFLLLLGLTILFVSFALGYVYTRAQDKNAVQGVSLPLIFVVNSVLLLASSWAMHRANRAYQADDTAGYQRMLWGTLVLTIAFLVAQVLGWTLCRGALLGDSSTGIGNQYLYALSGLHFAHVFGGLPFLLLFIRAAHLRMKEPVGVLVYFSDPEKRTRLQLLTIYWHFLDGLWLFLVAFFLLNRLV